MGSFSGIRIIGMADPAGVNGAAVSLQAYRLSIVFRIHRRIDCVLTAMAGLAEYPVMSARKPVQRICRFTVGRIVTLTAPGLINPGPSTAICQIFEVTMAILTGLSLLKHDASQTFGLRSRMTAITGSGHGPVINLFVFSVHGL